MINSVMIEGFVCNMKSGVSESGVMWARFSIGFRRKAGVVGFVNCVAYNKIADRMDRAGIRNGSNLVISGGLRIDEYTSKEGKKTSVPGINVNDFDILYRPKKNFTKKTEETSSLDSEIEKKYDLDEPTAPSGWERPADNELQTENTENTAFTDFGY